MTINITKKDIRDEVQDVLKERKELQEEKLGAESEWNKAYEDSWRADMRREYEEYLSRKYLEEEVIE